MNLQSKNLKRVVVISNKRDITVSLGDAVVIYGEKKMTSNSTAPYIVSLNALSGFLLENDVIDGVVTVDIIPSSYKVIKDIFEKATDFFRVLTFSINERTCNYKFFNPQYKVSISAEVYVEQLQLHLGDKYSVSWTKDNNLVYVVVEKN